MLSCGIIGLPLCGKTTIFNVITKAGAEVKPYASGRVDPNRAIVPVPDKRLDHLAKVFDPRRVVPATVEFVDLAGIARDASKGAGLGVSFLSFVEKSDALIHVLRAFRDPNVPHPEGRIDPAEDWEIVEMELILRDLSACESRIRGLRGKKRLQPEDESELALLERCRAHLLEGHPLREESFAPEEEKRLKGFSFLTSKPELLVLNLDEDQTKDDLIPGCERLYELTSQRGLELVKVYGRLEMEMAELSPEEESEFAKSAGIEELGRERLIRSAYRILRLISFFTVGKDEVRAWTIRDGSTAVEAAGAVHTDMAKGFIRAEVVHYEDFAAHDFSKQRCREKGLLRLEGRDYVVRDGDIIEIRFNV